MRFVTVTGLVWSLVALYAVAAAAKGGAAQAQVSAAFYLVSTATMGMFVAHSLERSARRDFLQQRRIRRQKEDLEHALSEVKVLRGLIPVCAWCRKVREDGGYWSQLEDYVSSRSEASFTHGICPSCSATVLPD